MIRHLALDGIVAAFLAALYVALWFRANRLVALNVALPARSVPAGTLLAIAVGRS